MTAADIANTRLLNQHIGGAVLNSPGQLAEWIGAIQAQDYPMAKWAFGVRLPGSDNKSIEDAADRGEILRTHLLRPTWHFVAARNIRWLISISSASIRASLLYRHRQLNIDDKQIERSLDLFRDILKGGNHLTREKIITLFREEGISSESTTTYHMLLWAELEGVVCSGKMVGRELSYALLDERAPLQEKPERDEAVARLVDTYFQSHGPASLKDFMWWSGLNATEARKGINNSSSLEKFDFEGVNYWMKPVGQSLIADSVFLLPAYDEYLISYTDRSAVLSGKFNSKAVSSNGIFRPVVIVNGKVEGLWKRTTQASGMKIEIELFRKHGAKTRRLIIKAAEAYSAFSGKNADIRIS